MTIKDWPASERPRERLLAHGAAQLSEAELLAVFLRTGLPGKSVLELARHALDHFGGLNGLLSAPYAQIAQLAGFGPAKVAQLHAALELARRVLHEQVRRDETLNSPHKVREYLTVALRNERREVFIAIFLDAQNRLLKDERLFEGTLTQTSVFPREVVQRALHHNAAAVIFAHNHPSGLAEPSRADEVLTRALKDALQLVDVRVLDHIIVAGHATVSLAERGLV